MKPRKRSHKGLLTRLRDAPNRRSKRESLPLRVLKWAGGAVFVAVMLGVVVLLGVRFMRPDLSKTRGTTVVTVSDVVPEPEGGSPTGAVARAVVQIENTEVRIPLDAEQATRVRPGSRLSVTYTHDFAGRRVVVDEWGPAP